MADLQKLFVLVSTAETSAFKTKYVGTSDKSYDNKICFLEGTSEIYTKGHIYGMSDDQSKKLAAIIKSIGLNSDGTLPAWAEGADSIATAVSIIDAVTKLDAKAKSLQAELDAEQKKVADSKTLDVNYEFTGKIKYVPATTGEGAVAAHIALVDEDEKELSSIPVSSIIGNGVLKSSAYDKATGILTLTFAKADGGEEAVKVNLTDLLDINDISVATGSEKYINIDLSGTEETSQAVFSIKVSKMADAALTGLADAADVKAYVDKKATDLAVEAAGDNTYIDAKVAEDNNKKINVSAKIGAITYTASEGSNAANLEGVAGLADSAVAAAAVKGYVDDVVAKEASDRTAAINTKIESLTKGTETVDGTNVHVAYSETNGMVTIESVTEDYATVNRTQTTSAADAPAEDAAISVTNGAKLVTGADLEKVALYAADLKAEEAHRVDKKIKDLAGDKSGSAAGVTTQVTTKSGEVSSVVVTVADNAVSSTGDKGARNLSATSTTDVIKGSAIAAIKDYVDKVVADNSTDLAVKAEGDAYITAAVDSADNKKIKVTADVQELTVGKVGEADSTLTGVAESLVDGADVAAKVSKFVNDRIGEEIAKLDVTETTTGDDNSNVRVTYKEVDGIVTISGVTEKYASATYSKVNDAAATFTVSDGTQLAKGEHIAELRKYVDAHVAEAVAGFTSSITEKDDSNFVTVTTAIANGALSADGSSVAVVYATHTAGQYGDGVATGAFVNEVLGDLWETYVTKA